MCSGYWYPLEYDLLCDAIQNSTTTEEHRFGVWGSNNQTSVGVIANTHLSLPFGRRTSIFCGRIYHSSSWHQCYLSASAIIWSHESIKEKNELYIVFLCCQEIFNIIRLLASSSQVEEEYVILSNRIHTQNSRESTQAKYALEQLPYLSCMYTNMVELSTCRACIQIWFN